MTNEEILAAAKEADAFYVANKSDLYEVGYCVYVFDPEDLQRFATIIEKRTIEKCAVRAFEFWVDQIDPSTESAAAAIRALGEQ